jgi:hypothetical protein
MVINNIQILHPCCEVGYIEHSPWHTHWCGLRLILDKGDSKMNRHRDVFIYIAKDTEMLNLKRVCGGKWQEFQSMNTVLSIMLHVYSMCFFLVQVGVLDAVASDLL